MKRVANSVAVKTILYTIKPYQKIKIVNYGNGWDHANGTGGEVVYDGYAKDTYGYKFAKIGASKVMGLQVVDDTMVFDICMNEDTY